MFVKVCFHSYKLHIKPILLQKSRFKFIIMSLIYRQAPLLLLLLTWTAGDSTFHLSDDLPPHKQQLSRAHLWSVGVVGGEPLRVSQRCKISKLLSLRWAEHSSGNSMMSETCRVFVHIPDWFRHIKDREVCSALMKGDVHMHSSNNTAPAHPVGSGLTRGKLMPRWRSQKFSWVYCKCQQMRSGVSGCFCACTQITCILK